MFSGLEEHIPRKAQQSKDICSAFKEGKPYVTLILYKSEVKFWTKRGLKYVENETTVFDRDLGLFQYKLYFTDDFNPPELV